jgi:hypothetical protein
MIVGFDFDNTIIDYTDLFKKIVRKKKLVPENLKNDKISIRNYLINRNLEHEWTILQGEVYGKNIMEAEMYHGVKEAFKYLSDNGAVIKIISHKTQFPYLGEKIDLRLSALKWIEKKILNEKLIINFNKADIFFENTIEDKVKKIKELSCDIYIDDLVDILIMLPNEIEKILFSTEYNNKLNIKKLKLMKSWLEFVNLVDLK